MKCPICNVELRASDREGIEIDYCPQCRGIWLDRDELDKIIERFMVDAEEPGQACYGEQRRAGGNGSGQRSRYRPGRHMDEEWIDELLDFES